VRLVVGLIILQFGVLALAAPFAGRMTERSVGPLDLQFMRTPEQAREYIALLGPDGVDAARIGLYLDFPYLVVYALALSAACIVLAARAAEQGHTNLAAAGRRIAWLAPVVAGLDAIENIAILLVLGVSVEQPWPAIAFGFAVVKWVLAAVVIGYLVVALVLTMRRRAETTGSAAEQPPTEPAGAEGS
jgi:hypothetical protein